MLNKSRMFNSLFVLIIYCSAGIAQAGSFFDELDTQKGLFDLSYKQSSDELFIHIRLSQLDQAFIFQSSLPRGIGSNDIGLDRGQLGDTRLVKFARFGNKVLLKQLNTQYRASSQNSAEQKSIEEAFASSVIAGFTIAFEDQDQIIIDYSDFLSSDIHGISDRLRRSKQGSYSPDKSRSGIFMARTKTFERNTELEALVTFAGKPEGDYIQDVSPDPQSVSVHLHHSFIALPDDDYTPRAFHPYSGYWKHSYMDYSVPINQDLEQKYIPRHRLSKKHPTADISEAVEPIIYYLDPGIPEPIMSALREGALWWNEAFTAAGYKDAFQVKVLPSNADPMDVRYNVIQWVHRATRGWSYGSSVIDPRTGEIIKGHVTLGSLRVRQDFLIATGFTAPYSTKEASTEAELNMALQRIRQLSAHEVGHTLGIAHNFAASENNRASVMDYPHPLISLQNGKIDLTNAYATGMGEWDYHTIAYGYQDFAQQSDENQALKGLLLAAKNKGLLYKSDPDSRISKRASAQGHLWDNGANPLLEFERVSELREFALAQFGLNNLPEGTNYSDLERRLTPIYYSHRYQLDALVKQISGLQYDYAVKDSEAFKEVRVVDEKQQQQALVLLLNSVSAEFLALPPHMEKLIPPKAYGSQRTRESMPTRMGIAFDPISAAEAIAGHTLRILLQSERLNRLAHQHDNNHAIPSVTNLSEAVFKKLVQNNSEKVLDQRLKYVALSVYFEALEQKELAVDVRADMQNVLLAYEKWLKKHARDGANAVLLKHLDNYWKHGRWALSVDIKSLPPGSPI